MAKIPRKIHMTPEMQQAYMQSVSKGRGAGYVNPHRRASRAMRSVIRSETERLRGLDLAGEERERIDRRQSEDVDYRERVFADQQRRFQDELTSNKRGLGISAVLGVGQLYLGRENAKATEAAAAEQRGYNVMNTQLQLDWLKKKDPKRFEWLMAQPQYTKQLEAQGIDPAWFTTPAYGGR